MSPECFVCLARSAAESIEVLPILGWRVPWKVYCQTTQFIQDAQRHGGHGSSLSVYRRDGGLRLMFTDQVMLHREALISSLAVFV